jgi:hypothetical protein
VFLCLLLAGLAPCIVYELAKLLRNQLTTSFVLYWFLAIAGAGAALSLSLVLEAGDEYVAVCIAQSAPAARTSPI